MDRMESVGSDVDHFERAVGLHGSRMGPEGHQNGRRKKKVERTKS
jgi:hypothetical protein